MPRDTQLEPVVFGPFFLNVQTGELSRSGARLRLPKQSFQILAVLLQQPRQVVTRDALRQELWSGDTYVDFEQGLNNAIKRLREALGDSVEKPRYVETVRGIGYRFIGPIATKPGSPAVSEGAGLSELLEGNAAEIPEPALRRHPLLKAKWIVPSAVLLSLLVVSAFVLRSKTKNHLRSIVVLPFANLSGDPSQDYLADAMTEEMTSDLGKISALQVISRTSAMHYKNTPRTTPEIAQELNVDGVIEGSVLQSGGRLRITAQLIDAHSDRHIWSNSYERDAKDIFTLQSTLARTIANQVKAVVTPAEKKNLDRQPVDPAAYEAYMRGRYYTDRWTAEDSARALALFQRAAELDANFALAYVGMTECYVYGVAGVSDKDAAKRGLAAVAHALELNADMGEAHAMLGMLELTKDGNFSMAEAELKKGIALQPNYAPAHHWYSHLLMDQGRYDEALLEARKLLELDPVSPTPVGHLADFYLATRQWDAAIAQFQVLFSMDPDLVGEHSQMGEAYLRKGRRMEAIKELRLSSDLTQSRAQHPFYLAKLGYALAQTGNVPGAHEILKELLSAEPQYAANVYAGLKDNDKSIALLSEALERHTFPLDAGYTIEFDDLRQDPRFVELLHHAGLR